jgi:hypothetical protein
MTRAALYACYSSDNRREPLIEDQLRLSREHAQEGWTVTRTYHDAAISGASMIQRPSAHALLQNAQQGQFDIVTGGSTRSHHRERVKWPPETSQIFQCGENWNAFRQ